MSKTTTKTPKALNNSWGLDPNEVVIIGIDTDHAEGEHPYRETDERLQVEVSRDLVDSIKRKGVLQAIGIRKTKDGLPEVAYGRRRVLACRQANAELIEAGETPILVPATVVTDSSDKEAAETMVEENAQRLELTPMNKAKLLKILLQYGHTEKEAAKRFGVSITAIKQWRKLLDLAPELVEKVDTGELSSSAGMELASLPKDEQVKVFAEAKAKAPEGKQVTVKTARNKRRKKSGSKVATKFTPPKRKIVKRVLEQGESLGIPPLALAMARWLEGDAAPEEVDGLKAALEEIEKAETYKVTEVQQQLIDDLAANGPISLSDVNTKSVKALGKKGIIERHTGEDGVDVARLTETYCADMELSPPATRAVQPEPNEASILDGSIGDLKKALESGELDDQLETLLADEKAGRDRKGAVAAIEATLEAKNAPKKAPAKKAAAKKTSSKKKASKASTKKVSTKKSTKNSEGDSASPA
jgi:ParB/RepB/Spo0J family partition protein